MSSRVAIITPVYNDWESFNILVENTTTVLQQRFNIDDILFVAVDDCSSQEVFIKNPKAKVKLILLNRNLGHQKAIAVGLSYASFNLKGYDYFIVMDSDGEDKPDDVLRLIDQSEKTQQIVFAKRSKRSESAVFKFFYKIYKLVFKLLTGQSIYFGNFSVIPAKYIEKIVHVSEIWNHYSGAIIRSRLPYTTLDSARGKRYFGQSKMNFTNLVLHGLSAVSIYMDQMAVRLLFLTIFLILFTISGVLVVLTMKYITHVAIPGWASLTILTLSIIFFQAFFIGLFMVFSVLSYRTNRSIIPAKDYQDFVLEVTDYERR